MSVLYVLEHGSTVGVDGGTITIKKKDYVERFPKETIDTISFYSNSQITAQCLRFCFGNGIPVGFFSETGRYYGRIVSNNSVKGELLKKQVYLSEDSEYVIKFARKVIYAKINNQLVTAKRYLREREGNPKEELFMMRDSRRKVENADSINKIRGFEGIAARQYFEIMRSIINPYLSFGTKRTRPATDPVNAMLNLGYSCLIKEICGIIESRGLSPYIGIIHSNHDKMPSLACDLIEEWRPIVIDSTVARIIVRGEVHSNMFRYDNGVCIMSQDAVKILLKNFEEKMFKESKYLSYISKPISFRQAIWHQVERLSKSIARGNSDYYNPILIR